MARRNEVVYNLAQEWIRWLDTRRFLGEPAQKNILDKLIQEHSDERRKPSKGDPDGPMSAEIAAFHLAVMAIAESDLGKFIPFIVVYCDYRPKPVKCLCGDLGIERTQFYERAHVVAMTIGSNARQLVELNSKLRREIEDYVID